MEELKKEVVALFDQFLKEEYGNKLSQFAILSLKTTVLETIEKHLNKENKDGTESG